LKWLRTAGKYSYGMYVYHLLLFLPVRSYLLSDAASWIHLNFPEKILFMISEIMAVFVVAKLSYDHFEFRFLKFKRYFNPA
jgi:peptidoglycan/LPS O-acetylase OafA/YrhL